MPFLQTSETTSEQTTPIVLPEPGGRRPASEPAPAPAGGSAWRRWLVVLVILLAIGAATWKIHSNTTQQAASANRMASMGDMPVPVQVVSVERKTMPIYLTALGTVTAYNTVTIKSRVDGQLMRVTVREGQAVRRGDLLMEIDPRPYAALVSQAQGQLVRDQATQVNAEAEAKRYTALQAAGVVSKESQQLQVSTAGQAQGNVEADQAAIDSAKVNLEYTRITSPIDGVVGLRQVDPGNIVHAADTTGLLVVTQLQPIAVIFTLPEDQLPQVLVLIHQRRRLVVEAYDRSGATHLATGYLLTTDNQIDPTTGTDKLKAVFDNKDGLLFPNQFVNVRLVLQERKDSIVIPSAAVQNGIEGSFVYVVKAGNPPAGLGRTNGNGGGVLTVEGATAAPRQQQNPYYAEVQAVEPELTEGGQMILRSGLEPGEQIVFDGQEKLKNGSRVTPRAAVRPNPAASHEVSAGAADLSLQPRTVVNMGDVNGRHQRGIDERPRPNPETKP